MGNTIAYGAANSPVFPATYSEFNNLYLNTPSASQAFSLGYEYVGIDPTTKTIKKFVYVYAAAALTANNIYTINPTGTVGQELSTGTPATTTIPTQYGVANTAVASGYYAFLQVEGDTTIATAGATTAGDTVKMANAVTTVTDETGTTPTVKTVGITKTTLGSAGNATVYLINKNGKAQI